MGHLVIEGASWLAFGSAICAAGPATPNAVSDDGAAPASFAEYVLTATSGEAAGEKQSTLQDEAANVSNRAGGGSDDLAQQLANPVASLIQVPTQSNIDYGIGVADGFRVTTNVQPVVPISLSEDWNVISRTIVPIVYQEGVTRAGTSQFGLGDTLQSLFFSPKAVGDNGIIWGAGPAILARTATDDALSGEKWGIGPTGVVLKQDGAWTFGLLANQIWSIAGDQNRGDISQAFVQPFVSYITQDQVTIAVNSETTYDWIADQATVPVNATVSKLYAGKQPLQIGVGARYYMERPQDGPEWGLRVFVTLLFPS